MGLALQCTSLGIRMYRTGHKDKQVWEHGQHAWGVCYLKVHINVLPICKYRCRTPCSDVYRGAYSKLSFTIYGENELCKCSANPSGYTTGLLVCLVPQPHPLQHSNILVGCEVELEHLTLASWLWEQLVMPITLLPWPQLRRVDS